MAGSRKGAVVHVMVACTRSAAGADIGLHKVLAPEPTFTREPDQQRCGVDFEEHCTRPRTGEKMGFPFSVAVSERTEFPNGAAHQTTVVGVSEWDVPPPCMAGQWERH
jgi:hypothetical protein